MSTKKLREFMTVEMAGEPRTLRPTSKAMEVIEEFCATSIIELGKVFVQSGTIRVLREIIYQCAIAAASYDGKDAPSQDDVNSWIDDYVRVKGLRSALMTCAELIGMYIVGAEQTNEVLGKNQTAAN